MSIPFQGFCGPTYQFENRYAAVERTVNFLTVPIEDTGEAKSRMILSPTPANAAFSQLPVPTPFNQPCRGLIENRGDVFGVNGNVVFKLDSSGVYTLIGTIDPADVDANPCSIVANGNGQVFLTSHEWGYVIPAGGLPGSLIRIGGGGSTGFLGGVYATFQDGYIIVISPHSNIFQISGDDNTPVGDATLWDAANVSAETGQADNLVAVLSSREYLRLFGSRRSEVFQNVGANGIGGFPFQSYNSTFIETGCAAPFSIADLGDSLIWLGQDARGVRSCWRDAAFSPQRASNFAVEQIWQTYARIDDAIAFPFIWQGHLLYQVTFPSAIVANPGTGFPLGAPVQYHSRTWVYNATASSLLGKPTWTERSYQTSFGNSEGRSELFHCYGYGRHLVGSTGIDGNPGAVYQYSDTVFTDCGTDLAGAQSQQEIVRDRICPHIWSNNKRLVFNRIEFELDRGQGTDGGAPGSDPQILLRWSNDGGNTYGPEQNASVGKIGEYSKRVLFNRCGSGRDRVFWVRCSDPIYWSICCAQLDLFECGV